MTQGHWDENSELNIKEAALFLERSVKTLYNMIATGEGPRRIKDGKYWKFKMSDLKRFKQQRRQVVEAFCK